MRPRRTGENAYRNSNPWNRLRLGIELQMTEQEVFEKMVPLVYEVTAVPEDEIKMDSRLMADLGADSIDLLDLSFLIEETFRVTIEADELEQQAKGSIPGGVYEKDGYLTEAALEELRKSMPEVDQRRLSPGLRRMDLPSLLSVAVLVHLVQRKQAEAESEKTDA